MNVFEFLDSLEETLNKIEVKGKNNLDALYGSLLAIDEYRKFLMEQMKQQMKQEIDTPEDGGDEVGRQGDIGVDSGSNGNGE